MTPQARRRKRRTKHRLEQSRLTAKAARKSLKRAGDQNRDADSGGVAVPSAAESGSEATGVAQNPETAAGGASKAKIGPEVDQGRKWHVVLAKPRWADRAVKDLAARGMPALMTHEEVEVVRYDGRRSVQRRQVLRRVMFVGLDEAQGQTLRTVADASFAVDKPVRRFDDERPLTVPAAQLADFTEALASGGGEPPAPFAVADDVRVKTGTFASWPGVVEAVDLDAKRLKVGIHILGSAQSLDLDFSNVERA